MEKTINIDGKDVTFKATGATVRLYRQKFQRDLFMDMQKLNDEVNGDGEMSTLSLEVFENLAYVMAKQADDSIPNSADEWLDGFTMFSIYQVFPELVQLWNLSTQTHVESKKKKGALQKDH